jgi:hypothetical protein
MNAACGCEFRHCRGGLGFGTLDLLILIRKEQDHGYTSEESPDTSQAERAAETSPKDGSSNGGPAATISG